MSFIFCAAVLPTLPQYIPCPVPGCSGQYCSVTIVKNTREKIIRTAVCCAMYNKFFCHWYEQFLKVNWGHYVRLEFSFLTFPKLYFWLLI